MLEQLQYQTLEELQALSIEELQALWELVPTDRQRTYRQAYEREVRNAGALGSDQLEAQVTDELLRRYADSALVPVGTRWARTPSRVQDAAKQDDDLTSPDDSVSSASSRPSALIVLAGALLFLMLMSFFLLRSGGDDTPAIAEATPEVDATVTPIITPTPTPLALEAQDDIIQDGDDERTTAYPVSLQVTLPDGTPPRLWVVQRRAIRASEWNYDPNPDIASFINGMSVRPVMGIPHSADNAAWFERMDEGTTFTVTMNTGATLRFEFASRSQVRRSETEIFRQVSPGLVLLLLGERDDMGLPTATRTLITATYPSEQELGRDGKLVGLTLPDLPPIAVTATPIQQNSEFADIDVQIISVTTQPGRLTTHFQIYNVGNDALHITEDDIQLASGYVPNSVRPYVPAENLIPIVLLSEQALDLELTWEWSDQPFCTLRIGEYNFSINLS